MDWVQHPWTEAAPWAHWSTVVAGASGELAGAAPGGWFQGKLFTMSGGKEREDLQDPHRRQMGAVRRLWSSDVEGRKRWCVELGGRAIRARMERADVRIGTVVWRRCSRAAFIGRGMTGGGRSRSNRRRLSGASMVKPFPVGEETGRGNRESGRGTEQQRRFVLPWERKGCCMGERSWRWRPVGLPEEEDGRAH
jgi:hypothetical protein